ncbi:hypothetical protein [Sphingomonas sp.]|uniref:hypothetical protein n=1 Tax=Sphingomonas sp. TaxID=28214 RepID=UPI002C8AF0C9|nr:hypothetical protein [Sphingomonas sp.]HWK36497.1 hypothetical protein [Sphingomonas sp.]
MPIDNDPRWNRYARALDILERRANGHALPIIRRLAHRGFSPAITVLTDYVPERKAIRLLRRSARNGDPVSAYNLAITHRNLGDMLNYRLALAHAARLDESAAEELRKFQTRFPEEIMRQHGRKAPRQR